MSIPQGFGHAIIAQTGDGDVDGILDAAFMAGGYEYRFDAVAAAVSHADRSAIQRERRRGAFAHSNIGVITNEYLPGTPD
jgi:hypothetical protein